MIRSRSDRGPIPPEAWGEGSQMDWERCTLYGADGVVYRNIKVWRPDVEALVAKIKERQQQRRAMQ